MKSSNRSSFKKAWQFLTILLIVSGYLSIQVPVQAASVVGYGEYYIFGTDAQILDALDDIPNSGASGAIHSRLSIVSSSNGVNIYLDEAEDGYDFNSADPYNTADAKWDIAVGGANEQGDSLDRGEVLTLTEADTYVVGSTGVGGGDRIYVTGAPVSVVRTVWPTNPGPYLAGSWELFPVQRWQSSYIVPVGEDTDFSPDSTLPFEYTFLFVQAESNNTHVVVSNPPLAPIYDAVINQGETALVRNVDAGIVITATIDGTSTPTNIQAGLITSVNQVYDSRYFTLTPQPFLCNEYYVSTPSMQFPLDEFAGRSINNVAYIYSFQNGTNVTIETATGSTNITLAHDEVYRFVMPEMPRGVTQGDYGARITTDDPSDLIWVLIAGDDDAPDLDWGHQALCVDLLTNDYFIPFAPYNPAHVTPVNDNTEFYVDWDSDGVVDETFTLDRFETRMLYDFTDQIATGAHVFASGDFMIAWGQDNTENTGDERLYFPGDNDLDFGYSILPMGWSEAILGINKTANPTLLPTAGGVVTYTLVITNEVASVYNLAVNDTLPTGWAYVTDSTAIDLSYDTGGSGPVYNPSISGQVITWDLSVLGLNDIMPSNSAITVTYQTQTTSGYAYGSNINIAEAYGSDIADDTDPNAAIFRPNDTAVVTIPPANPAAIGNYIWFDENGDGVQDAGEDGIANVVVELYDSGNNLIATTTTDANGGYVFTGVAPGTYTVVVNAASLPAGLNATYDEDGGADSQSGVTVVAGEEHMTADFGYNWVPPTDSANPGMGATGAIGDRIWNDADGDGQQDPGESGIENVTVRLLVDSNGDGVYGGPGDDPAVTTTTDANGNYIFDGLAPDAYVIEVDTTTLPGTFNTTPTGDPDGDGDNTTNPIILAPGDVFLNADFGYNQASSSTIGDTIFVDNDADGVVDAGEAGIPGVTVALLNSSGDVIATTITDENGEYFFPGLPAGTYTVWVTDTNNVLGELDPISDPDGGLDNQSTTTVDGSSDDLDQDFGYASPEHLGTDGFIGDTVFMDYNGSNGFDPGEGIEGVTVELYDSTGTTLLATTTTDENGNYYFGNLDPAATYVVQVDATTLPNGGVGLTNSIDPDGGAANQSTVDLSLSGGVNLDQDFGYTAGTPNTISGTIWEDTNADGALSGEAGRFAGVTVVLYDSDGNIVATTGTDASGNYSFPGLPDGTYTVDVTDDNNILAGYWHSDGPNDGLDNNSQDDPYTVTVSGGQTNTTADFGYYVDPAVVGNFVWLDLNGDGVQDANEPGIEGVPVTLTITYPNGDSTVVVALTGDGGIYSFENLLLDESFNTGDSGGATPTYTISVDTPPSMTPSPEAAPANNDQVDGDSDGASEIATVLQGETDPSYDFGFNGNIDLGDLPEGVVGYPDYPTYFLPGPAHIVFPTTNGVPTTTNGIPAVWLGLIVDSEADGQPTYQANGDDANGDDEDGLTFAQNGYTTGAVNQPITITINASEPAVTVFYGLWIDWNADGDFADPDDAFYSGSGVSGSPADLVQLVDVPASYIQNASVYFRLRASAQALDAGDFEGTFVNGEVEDYGRAFVGPTAIRLKSLRAQSGVFALGWVALAVTLVALPAVGILRKRKRRF